MMEKKPEKEHGMWTSAKITNRHFAVSAGILQFEGKSSVSTETDLIIFTTIRSSEFDTIKKRGI